MENLNKENFWNELYAKYPDAMKEFCKWIDEYKERNNWNKLFNFGSPHYAKQGWHDIKYHDLPFAMQIGIWIEYVYSTGDKAIMMVIKPNKAPNVWREEIANFIKNRQVNIVGSVERKSQEIVNPIVRKYRRDERRHHRDSDGRVRDAF